MDIRIKAKLKAYTKGILPTKVSDLENDLHFIEDVNGDGVYVRAEGQWIRADQALDKTIIELVDDSGLDLIQPPLGSNVYQLGIRKWEGTQLELPNTLENDKTYYVEELTANNYINGGTAFSNGNNDFVELNEFTKIVNGGTARSTANIILNPINSEGVYNG